MNRNKTILVVLAVLVCFVLTGCKSQSVSSAESKIRAIGSVTVEKESAVQAARTAYDALPDSEKDQVENYSVLENAEFELAALKIEGLIEAIGEVTLDSGDAIREARSAFDSQLPAVQTIVRNIGDLRQAEETYRGLEMQNWAASVDEQILAIGTVTLDSGDAIEAAVAAYEGLSEDEQALVQQGELLQKAREDLERLQDAAALRTIQTTVASADYAAAADYALEYLGGRDLTGVKEDLITAGVHACVLKAQMQERAGQNEAAEETLAACVNFFMDCAAVSEAERAQSSLQAKLEKLIPANGAVLRDYTGGGRGELRVENHGPAAVIKLENSAAPESDYVMIFVNAGEAVAARVKDGSYAIKYATGEKWYGEAELFGSGTLYRQAKTGNSDDTVVFESGEVDSGPYHSSVTVVLPSDSRTAGGILTITRDDF